MCTCADGRSCTQGGVGTRPHVQEGGDAHRVGGNRCTKKWESLRKNRGNPPGEVGLHKKIAQLGAPLECTT